MDDYYEMLGIEPGAKTAEIKEAYRERKSALDTGSDAGKADAAKLNKAWNVLSDPYQRGRYDAQREQGRDDDTDEDTDDDTASRNGAASKRPARQPRQPRQPREPLKPTIPAPPGTSYPTSRERLTAMGIDLLILVALLAVTILAIEPAIEKAVDKPLYTCVTKLQDAVNSEPSGAADKAKVQSNSKIDAARAACAAKNVKVTGAYQDDNKTFQTQGNKLVPLQNTIVGGFFLVAFLYLLIPTLISGSTFGKSRKHLKVMRVDGSRIRAGDAISRYGLLILISFALSLTPLGPLGAVIVLVGVTTWMRHPNMQGIHDRIAKTIVVKQDS